MRLFIYLGLSLIIFTLVLHCAHTCFTKIPSSSRRLIRHSSKLGIGGSSTDQESSVTPAAPVLRQPGTATQSPYSKIFISVLKFLLRNFLYKRWTKELAIKRLDNLKTSLVKYYAKRSLFQGFPGLTTVSTARDKGIGFPSLEGALLSLAFLTFSVFLIDMIQSLLAKLKMRTATAAPAQAVALGRGFLPMPERTTSFSFPLFEDKITTLSSRVLSAIEKPSYE